MLKDIREFEEIDNYCCYKCKNSVIQRERERYIWRIIKNERDKDLRDDVSINERNILKKRKIEQDWYMQ